MGGGVVEGDHAWTIDTVDPWRQTIGNWLSRCGGKEDLNGRFPRIAALAGTECYHRRYLKGSLATVALMKTEVGVSYSNSLTTIELDPMIQTPNSLDS